MLLCRRPQRVKNDFLDSVGRGVLTHFLARPDSALFETQQQPDSTVRFVFVDGADVAEPRPAIIHRVVLSADQSHAWFLEQRWDLASRA
jgi:hypothetical protein